jgi:hypothetical protein
MTQENPEKCRYFVSYTGVKPPVKMVNPLEEADLTNRNTFIRAFFDDQDRLLGFEKMVYGEVEIYHRYEYSAAGTLTQAEISMDEDVTILKFNEAGELVTG